MFRKPVTRFKIQGVTLVEMVVVMVIVGILAVTGLSRFNSASSFHERGYADETLAAIHYAHRLATSGGCHTRVQLSSGNLSVARWPTCIPSDHSVASITIDHPNNSGTFTRPVPAGLTTGSIDIYFDGRGRPHNTGSENLLTTAAVLSIGGRSLSIEPETGYAY